MDIVPLSFIPGRNEKALGSKYGTESGEHWTCAVWRCGANTACGPEAVVTHNAIARRSSAHPSSSKIAVQ